MNRTDADIAKLVKSFEGMRKELAPQVMSRSINRILSKAKTQAVSKSAKELKVRVKDIRPRVFVRRSSKKVVRGQLRGYAKPMPVISIVSGRKGQFVSRKAGRRRSGLGGVKIGGLFMQNAFVNVVRRSQTVHILRRQQKATWAGSKRLPIDVVKIEIEPAFNRHFIPAVEQKLKSDYQKEFDANFNYYLARVLAR